MTRRSFLANVVGSESQDDVCFFFFTGALGAPVGTNACGPDLPVVGLVMQLWPWG